jgi:hypothetical protein
MRCGVNPDRKIERATEHKRAPSQSECRRDGGGGGRGEGGRGQGESGCLGIWVSAFGSTVGAEEEAPTSCSLAAEAVVATGVCFLAGGACLGVPPHIPSAEAASPSLGVPSLEVPSLGVPSLRVPSHTPSEAGACLFVFIKNFQSVNIGQ